MQGSAQKWVSRLWVNTAECKYKENAGKLKEQLINGMNDEAITTIIFKYLMVLKDNSEVSSELSFSLGPGGGSTKVTESSIRK